MYAMILGKGHGVVGFRDGRTEACLPNGWSALRMKGGVVHVRYSMGYGMPYEPYLIGDYRDGHILDAAFVPASSRASGTTVRMPVPIEDIERLLAQFDACRAKREGE